jgi:hypothetical protein
MRHLFLVTSSYQPKENDMNIENLFNKPSSYQRLRATEQSKINRLGKYLCRKVNINPADDSVTLEFSDFNDKNNLQAICSWITQEMEELSEASEKALKSQLFELFCRRLNILSTDLVH